MLRDHSNHRGTQGNVDLTASPDYAVTVLLKFIEKRISGFCNYYIRTDKPDRENYITNHLVNYFNSCLNVDGEGYLPYKFSFQKNPAQQESSKETDVGIFILNSSVPSNTIFEFEAKRLSESSNNSEYVYGTRGGMERFKRNHHSRHLKLAGMLGYVQSHSISDWIGKINEWIKKCSSTDTEGIEWKGPKEKLEFGNAFGDIEKFYSVNSRENNQDIQLSHYFINLTSGVNRNKALINERKL